MSLPSLPTSASVSPLVHLGKKGGKKEKKYHIDRIISIGYTQRKGKPDRISRMATNAGTFMEFITIPR